MPYGNDDWLTLHTFWENTIGPGLAGNCHQTRRFDVEAWPDCQSGGLTEAQMEYFAHLLYQNVNFAYYETDNKYSDYIEEIHFLSPKNWFKIGNAYGQMVFGVIASFSLFFIVMQ